MCCAPTLVGLRGLDDAGLAVVDEGFDPVGGRECDGPKGRGGAVKGEGEFEALFGEGFDADDAAGFGLIGLRVGEGDDVAGCHGGDGELNGAAVGVDHGGLGVDDPLALKEMKAGHDADFEEDALAAAAIGYGGVCGGGASGHLVS